MVQGLYKFLRQSLLLKTFFGLNLKFLFSTLSILCYWPDIFCPSLSAALH